MNTVNFNDHYVAWRKSRIDVTVQHYGSIFFKDKTLLEIGCGWGDTGNIFSKYGSIVTVSDARKEHVERAARRYPHLTAKVVDAESTEWQYDQNFDVIIHWGVLYHLKNPAENLELFAKHCKHLVLETEVSDSNDPDNIIFREENTDFETGGWGMAYSGIGCLPSYAWVERELSKNYEWTRLDRPERANAEFHHYDWKRTNSNGWKSGQRAFWFCKSKIV
jgi:ubiquinone/menaquinone biosynthesis C-methylase UbiE